MAFDSLSDKLQNVFKKLRSKGVLTEDDVKEAMKEVKRALLEADVNFKVVKSFVKSVSDRAVGEEVLKGLNPGHMVIKIVKEEMDKLMGSEMTEIKLRPSNEITVIMMCGLQGAGKTTTVAKLAYQFKNKGKKPLLVACDVYRPAAIKQLQVNGEKVGVPVFAMGTDNKPLDIAKAAINHAAKNNMNLVFLDTAGRLHVDEDMMNELEREKKRWKEMPEKVAGKGMSWTAKLGIAAVIMVAVICIIVFIVSSISHKVSYRVEQKNLEKLESLYQSGDYEGICEYLKTVEYTYQSYFDKYTEIAGMQRYLNYLNDEDDSYLQWVVENDKADALSNISYIVSILNECQEAADAYYKYEEEDAVAYYKEYCYDYMKEHYEISEDEIKSCIDKAGGLTYDDKDQITEALQKLAISRLKDKME